MQSLSGNQIAIKGDVFFFPIGEKNLRKKSRFLVVHSVLRVPSPLDGDFWGSEGKVGFNVRSAALQALVPERLAF